MHHLTEQQLNAYAGRTLHGTELLQADDHLAACSVCAKRLQSVLRASNGGSRAVNSAAWELTAPGEDFHLSFEQIHALVAQQVDAIDQEIINSHLAECPNCQAEIADLQQFAQLLSQPPPRRAAPVTENQGWRAWLTARWVLIPAAATLALGALGLWLYQQPVPESTATNVPAVTPTATIIAPVAERSPEASPTATLAPVTAEDRALQRALATGQVEIPADSKALRLSGSRLLSGTKQDTTFSVVAPTGVTMESRQPRLMWTALADAKSYVVTITDQNFNEVTKSLPLTAPYWIPTIRLERGKIYQWQVTATTAEGREITAPLPSAPEARFQVLSQEAINTLTRARQQYAGSPLELGIIYARVGLLDEAARAFRAERNRVALARRLLTSLQQQR